MAHNPYEIMISLSLDGLLSEEEGQELDAHLQACEACTDLHARMALVDGLLAQAPQVVPQVNLTTSVMGRIGAYETRRRWQPWIVGVLVLASLLAAVCLAVPIAFFSLGLQETVAQWPVVVRALGAIVNGYTVLQSGADLAYEWLMYVVTEPVALGVVIGGLVLASMWIGMMEVSKVQQPGAGAQEA